MIILVGEAPSRHLEDTEKPLLGGYVGERLAELLGVTLGELQGTVESYNLFREPVSTWSSTKARTAAAWLSHQLGAADCVILCGRRVAQAFALKNQPWLRPVWVERVHTKRPRVEFVVLPHPSGRNRWWNNEDNHEQARVELRRIWRRYA